jgi:hypothetical protein
VLALAAVSACGGAAPPSRFPDAEVALERMRHTQMCSRGVQGEAKIDYFGEEGRVKGSVLYKAALPDRVRLDVFSPFGVILSTLTSDGRDFAWFDLRQKTFLQGAAKACNLRRFLHVPVPPHALVQLLRGEAPVLVHEPGAATIEWQSGWYGEGRYVVRVPSRHGAAETIELVPRPQDWARGYREQALRVLRVEVVQRGYVLYRVELTDHRAATTAAPRTDPDILGVTLKPSGPSCRAELPGRLRFEVPSTDRDVVFTNTEVVHNPPIGKTSFEQPIPSGVSVRSVVCRD